MKQDTTNAHESLGGLRLAITMPPQHYFGGVDRARALDSARALRELGADVHELELAGFYEQERDSLTHQVDALKAFRPDAVIAAPHAGYALESLDGSDPEHQQNLFLDVLGLPVILYWDHVIPQLPNYIISSRRSSRGGSSPSILSRMRQVMNHPNAIHYFPDTGHIARLRKLGVEPPSADSWFVTSIPSIFIEHGDERADRGSADSTIAFFGNFYLAATKCINYSDESGLLKIRERALSALAANWDLAPYDAYVDQLHSADPDWRSRFHLEPDQAFYWKFLFDELSVVANGELRQRKLKLPSQAISYFGGFADPQSCDLVKDAGWSARGSRSYGAALAAEYGNSCIAVDIANAPFINGFSPKLLECFASGGFMLTDRSADAARAIGEFSEVIGFSSADELSGKVDRFLTRERERHEVTREIREIVRRNYTASALLSRTIPAGLDKIRSRAGSIS